MKRFVPRLSYQFQASQKGKMEIRVRRVRKYNWITIVLQKWYRLGCSAMKGNVNEPHSAKGNLHANWLLAWYDKKTQCHMSNMNGFQPKTTLEAVIFQVELIKLQPPRGLAKWLTTRSCDPSAAHETAWHGYIATWKGTPSIHVKRLMVENVTENKVTHWETWFWGGTAKSAVWFRTRPGSSSAV